jgi:transcription-repair coupling factor (superfamily II helicase)
VYDTNFANIYKYAEQISIIKEINNIDILICPLKSCFEKIPTQKFFRDNQIKINKEEETDIVKLSQKLIDFGYKRVTTVTDVGEYSVRGDTTDIYSSYENPVRIEFWGDTVTDLRFFDADTQRSIEKVQSITIEPISKFIKTETTIQKFKEYYKNVLPEFLKDKNEEEKSFYNKKYEDILTQIEEDIFFEGIKYYTNIFNEELKTIIEIISEDYIIVFDEYDEIKSRYKKIDRDLQRAYEDNLRLPQTLPLKEFSHSQYEEFTQKLATKNKIYFESVITEENETQNIIETNTEPTPMFSGNLVKVADFIKEKRSLGYKIIIGTDYQNRIAEILKDFEIPYTYTNESRCCNN